VSGVDRETADLVRGDMAEHQKRFGREVTDGANAALLNVELEKLDNMRRDMRTSSGDVAMPTTEATAPRPTTIERKTVDGREFLLKTEVDRPLLRKANEFEAWFLSHAMPRMEKLMSLPERGILGAPSWRERVMAIMAIRNQATAWTAAAEAPAELLKSRHQIEKDQTLLKKMGLETISELTPAFARAKAQALNERYVNELCLLLEESNALGFGDWKADPEKKVTVSG
jgi:hypothetical protein